MTILTDEDLPFYYRVRLPEVISGEIAEGDLVVRKEDWYAERNIELMTSTRIVDADPSKRVLITADNEKLEYDTLLVATGSHSFIPPIKGSDKKGVFSLRSIQDARDIVSWSEGVQEVVLIGGGLLGLEAGNAIRKLGKKVMVVEFFPRLLPRQLDVAGAGRLQKTMEDMGFSFRLGAVTQEIAGEGIAEGVVLEGGERLPAGTIPERRLTSREKGGTGVEPCVSAGRRASGGPTVAPSPRSLRYSVAASRVRRGTASSPFTPASWGETTRFR